MEFLKNWSYHRKLQNKLNLTSNPKSANLNSGRHIGIVFDYKRPEDYQYLEGIADQFKSEGKIIRTLGYIDEEVNAERFNFKAFSKKNIGWDGIPDHVYIEEFLDSHYDLLFFPVRSYNKSMQYIAKLSRGHLKVGTYHPDLQDYYDILLEFKEETRINDIFDQFLMHIKVLTS